MSCPGCDTAHGLENHHWDVDYAVCKHDLLTGLARVCSFHHGLLTYGGWILAVAARGLARWRNHPAACRFETGPPFATRLSPALRRRP